MRIDYDARSLRLDGERKLLLMGEIHYSRSPRELWPSVLDRSVACGLNAIASYIFWNAHEPEKGRFDFGGDHDLAHFLELCAERNLVVLLRMGPYCCAEWNYGGYPAWLREEPDITIRTWNEPYMRRVECYFRHLCAEIRPYLATNGGPVILAQVENEYANVAARYGEGGQRYLAWMAELARDLGIDVPILMCEGAAPGVVETVNGHSISDDRVAAFRQHHPELPMIWTELWPAWYDTWGFQSHRRSPRNIAWHILRFIGHGGSGINYYMWHGGTNFGRTSMYLQTTCYGFEAPLDEYGQISGKGAYLAGLHKVLAEQQATLLEGEIRRTTATDGIVTVTWKRTNASLTLVLNPKDQHAVLRSGEAVLFDTETAWDAHRGSFVDAPWEVAVQPGEWRCWREPVPYDRPDLPIARAGLPVEQLALTGDRSDYCWYGAFVNLQTNGVHELVIERGGDLFDIYLSKIGKVRVADRLVGRSQPPLRENRGPTLPREATPGAVVNLLEQGDTGGYRHVFRFRAKAGQYPLFILAKSLGLVKGDWMLSGPMNEERKGIWGEVRVDGQVHTPWVMYPGLIGELWHLERDPNPVRWRPAPARAIRGPAWYETTFKLDAKLLSHADFRLDARGLGKGMLFVNGHALGRHWLVAGHGYGADEGWQKLVEDGLSLAPEGEPTQRWYHLPAAWLKERNRLVIFDEEGANPRQVTIDYRLGRGLS